jgi:hypothetical protein
MIGFGGDEAGWLPYPKIGCDRQKKLVVLCPALNKASLIIIGENQRSNNMGFSRSQK